MTISIAAEATTEDGKRAKDWLRAVEAAFEQSWSRGQMPTFGRARPDVHRVLSLVGYSGPTTVALGDQRLHSTDGSIIELNGIPILRSEDAAADCVELGIGANITEVALRVTLGSGVTDLTGVS